SRFVYHPKVGFDTVGEYDLTLTVNGGAEPYDRTSTVTITVVPNPRQDNTDPNISFVAEVDGVPIVTDQQDVNGTITITVDANDENLDYIELKMTKGGSEIVIPADEYYILGGTPEHPTKLQQIHTLDAYFSGDVTLQATAYDQFGNDDTESLSFNSNHTIRSFAVAPNTITTYGEILNFSAVLNSTENWTINIYEANDVGGTPICDPCTGNGSQIPDGDDAGKIPENGWGDGAYVAELDANGHQAYVPFDVAINLSSVDLVADINNTLKIQYDSMLLPLNARPTITEGLYDLWGKAYHPDFNDVYFKIELYDSDVQYYWGFDTNNFDPAFLIKNVTPGYLDEEGFRKGPVGTDVVNGLFGSLDFSTIENGVYYLLLTVKCHGLTQRDRGTFALDCPLKVGNVKFSQEDLVVPIGSYPLRVVRTYDSLNKDKDGDFGYGWVYTLANLDIELNEMRETVGSHTERVGGDYDRDVTLTLPDGRRVTFASYLYGSYLIYPYFGIVSGDWTLEYEQPEGVGARLFTDQVEAVHYQDLGSQWWWNDYPPQHEDYAAWYDMYRNDVNGFRLLMEDGTLYNIKRYAYPTQQYPGTVPELGEYAYEYDCRGKPYLASIDLPSGDKVVFDVNLSDPEDPLIQKVKYYQKGADLTDPNKTIVIERGDHDHITAIYPPSELDSDGNVADGGLPAVQYEYDGYHNLVKVHKLVDRDADPADQNETTTYVYDDYFFDPWDHFITDIRDPRGLSPIRYVYDEGGRLVAIYDAKGNYIEIEHDISNRTETITD
ncbi:MAG: DUF6531 domain-containing protein, partial [Planctomycetota bacterium]